MQAFRQIYHVETAEISLCFFRQPHQMRERPMTSIFLSAHAMIRLARDRPNIQQADYCSMYP